MPERTNEQWLEDLRGPSPRRDDALEALRALLVRGLRAALAGWSHVRDEDIEDFAQETLVRILGALDTFRGQSQFTTWAQKIAVRVAFTELRRRRWHDVSLDQLLESVRGEFTFTFLADKEATPEQQVLQRLLWEQVRRAVEEELTERQRQALVAVVFHGVPLEEVAKRLGTNRNALYKLLHDARKRLKARLLAGGLSHDEVLAAFERHE
ncbi:MAG: sigma-70 family RNA polymerase sigma factor [Ardenticatenia bacterium]|nr:sigma-70 family RNA polymerase sigma factor [Ardenticatenia bacterium]